MPTNYNYYDYMYPMTVEFNGNEYYIEHVERSIEHCSLDDFKKDCIRIDAWKPFSVQDLKTEINSMYGRGMHIKKVVFNGPATIVFWTDGTKTIVKCAEGDKYDRKVALLYAIAKKKFGNNSRVHKEIDPFASSNAQRVAILKYILAKDGFDIDKIMDDLVCDHAASAKMNLKNQ